MARKARPEQTVRKTRTKKDQELEFLRKTAENNIIAAKDGPRRKNFSPHDLKYIKPLTETQRMMFESYFTGNHILANGSAGTGKSYIALWLALNTILSDEPQDNIIIVRSNVNTGSQVGHLPGTLEEKMMVYETPYHDIVADLMGRAKAYDDMKAYGKINFMPTAFIRGCTWDNAVIIFDESQNATEMEINSIMTRVGKNSRVIVCGDINQNDMIYKKHETSGFSSMLKTFQRMNNIDIITFTPEDIVRSGFVRAWIMAREG